MQPEIRGVVDRFVAGLGETLGRSGSAVLYGSAARNEYLAGRSDLNILLVTDSLAPASLARLRTAIAPLRGHTRAPPLLVTSEEWGRSADVFPIEIVDMQAAREVLAGPDPVAALVVERDHLRGALERELRGKLLRLRQAWVALGDRPEALGEAMVGSSGVVGVLLRAVLVLAGERPPVPTVEVIARAAARLGFEAPAIEAIWRARSEKAPAISAELAERYLAAVEHAVHFIDQFHGGGTS